MKRCNHSLLWLIFQFITASFRPCGLGLDCQGLWQSRLGMTQPIAMSIAIRKRSDNPPIFVRLSDWKAIYYECKSKQSLSQR
ncbi:hypothetical protein VMB_16910 [Vibrio mimicus VM603]|uniref:Uncharacterized protein n=1 Tax=Vibrio mimicus VM603 TaxID=671074 RepID=D2YDU4_VIBMI|nr:hypothetical protein VMB_16910 [Vibrio mimicus VM603]